MEFRSDYQKIQHLMETDDINDVQFSDSSEENERQYGGISAFTDVNINERSKNEPNEKRLFAIFQKAINYRDGVKDNNELNQKGGQIESGEKPKKSVNKTLRLMLDLTKIMKNLGKYPDIKQKDYMKVSKMILDEAKKREGTEEVTPRVAEVAEKIAQNPDEYIQKVRLIMSQSKGNNRMSSTKSYSKRSYNKRNGSKRSGSKRSHSKRSNTKKRLY